MVKKSKNEVTFTINGVQLRYIKIGIYMTKDTAYVSELTQFIRSLYQQDPQLRSKQQAMHDTWWDQGFIDEQEQMIYNKSEDKLSAYAYF